MTTDARDVVIVGGGLQGCCIVLALAARADAASLRVTLVEQAAELCGNHTWCLHAGDVPFALEAALAPAIVHRWPGYDVAFADHARRLDSPYAGATSSSLATATRAAAARAGFAILTDTRVRDVAADHVTLADGRRLDAAWVIDARGPSHLAVDALACGYQKFVGLELELAAPHALDRPMLMDAAVPQLDGFRFVYVLPLGPRRILVEDTYFSDTPRLDVARLEAGVLAYASARGYATAEVVRTERGVLPLPLALAMPASTAPLVAGYAGGWFHPTTGYSFPLALRLAAFVAAHVPGDATTAYAALAGEHARQLAFALRLNRMLFRWFAPAARHHVLARFYRCPEDTVRRFYALQTTRADRARILCGRPPRGLSWRAVLGGGAAT